MNPILSSLTTKERDALATCGILNDGQLAGVDVDVLLRDLKLAQEAFPDAHFSLPEAKLRSICAAARGGQSKAPVVDVLPAQEEEETPIEEDKSSIETEIAEVEVPRALPELSLRRHQHRAAGARRSNNMSEPPGVSSSVHCSRPMTTYLSALSMVSFYAGLLLLVLLPFLIFTGTVETDYLLPCALSFVALLIPYFFVGVWCHCSVCKMKMFRLVPYNINRHAHVIPFLGLTTLMTAMHIIFCLWYRCPACGTAIRLFRSRHSHHRH